MVYIWVGMEVNMTFDRDPVYLDVPVRTFTAAVLPIAFRPYDDIWGTQWSMGVNILTDIIIWLKGKSLIVVFDVDTNTANITIPLPSVIDELDGKSVSVLDMIPGELQTIFLERCDLVINARREQVMERLSVPDK